MKTKELSDQQESLSEQSRSSPSQTQLDQQNSQHCVEASSPRQIRRVVHFGDPDYYDHLPPHLQYLKNLPFVIGAFGYFPPSYELEVNDVPDPDCRRVEAIQSKNHLLKE